MLDHNTLERWFFQHNCWWLVGAFTYLLSTTLLHAWSMNVCRTFVRSYVRTYVRTSFVRRSYVRYSLTRAWQALPLNESLVLETLRALRQDLAQMIVAAERCVEVERLAAAQSPMTGGCRNILLDDIMEDFETGYHT